MAKRHKLTREQKTFIVTHLACMDSPSTVRDDFVKEYGVKLTLQTIVWYNPEVDVGKQLATEWIDLFERTREQFINDTGRVPIANKAYRMRKLQQILDTELERKNTVGARDTLKQAAEEDGGKFTNKHELTGQNGSPLMPSLAVTFVDPGTPGGSDGGA